MMDIEQLHKNGVISRIDQEFATMMGRYPSPCRDIVEMAAALVSRAAAHGNVCLDLDQSVSFLEEGRADRDGFDFRIDPQDWIGTLKKARVVGHPGEYKPLILDGTRLYLNRYWQYEQDVAAGILQRCRSIVGSNDVRQISKKITNLFPEGDEQQRRAVLTALTQGFAVISGGPGTGKTYTIAKLIQLMQEFNQGGAMRIMLAAPTGKAAMRLQQAIESAMADLGQGSDAFQNMGGDIQTLHRLLGAMSSRSGFRYNTNNKLQVDAVIVDEASMIDMSLMAALISALPDSSRLVLIGDKNQLASVEAGAVLGDICSGVGTEAGNFQPLVLELEKTESLGGRIVVLQHSYRFESQGGIDALAGAVNIGDTEKVKALLENDDAIDLVYRAIPDIKRLDRRLNELVSDTLVPNFRTQDPFDALARMERFIILSPFRNGPFGVVELNKVIERALVKQGVISQERYQNDGWYAGRPVMITRNDYYNNLYNGDIGVAMPNSKGDGGDLSVFFKDGTGGCKQLPCLHLPHHETAYVMTVHKSQGSEFDRVILLLPERESPVLTRELVYTAITRARRRVEIWGSEDRLLQAIQQRTQRSTGLMQLLWS